MRIIPPLVLVLAVAGVARAEDVIATSGQVSAPPHAATPAAAPALTTSQHLETFLGGGGAEPEPRRMHGEVGVALGSSGNRSAYGVAVIPVGQSGTVAVAVSEGRGGRGRFLHPCGAPPDAVIAEPTSPRCVVSPNASRQADVAN